MSDKLNEHNVKLLEQVLSLESLDGIKIHQCEGKQYVTKYEVEKEGFVISLSCDGTIQISKGIKVLFSIYIPTKTHLLTYDNKNKDVLSVNGDKKIKLSLRSSHEIEIDLK